MLVQGILNFNGHDRKYIFQDGTSRAVILGVVSRGPMVCGRKGKSGQYTDVPKMAAWVKNNMKTAQGKR